MPVNLISKLVKALVNEWELEKKGLQTPFVTFQFETGLQEVGSKEKWEMDSIKTRVPIQQVSLLHTWYFICTYHGLCNR